MKHKNQHVVPVSYLKEWCDPSTPDGQEPYIWIVSKDGEEIKKRAPKNVFGEHDFYTVYDENGNRYLEFEHRLKIIEDGFLIVREAIKQHQPINDEDMKALSLFISSAFSRTRFQQSDQREIWEDLLNIYHVLGIRRQMPSVYRQIERIRDQPTPFFLVNFINITFPVLIRMNLTILETSREIGFITSDNPVLWIDASLMLQNYPLTFYGLRSPMLEIFMPISPRQLVKLSWNDSENYIFKDSESQIVDEINSLVVGFSEEYVILNHNMPNPYWFGSENK